MALFKRTREDERLAELRDVVDLAETPTFPQLTLRILDNLRDPEVDFARIAESLQWDAALVARVLRTVNSAAYGTSQPIVDVRHAVSFLGRSQLEQLVIALAVKDALPGEPARGFVPQRFWQVASFRAALSRTLANRLHPSSQAESFTAGLLQDMAVPLLAHSRSREYGEVLEAWHGDPRQELEGLEREVFGWDHSTVGGLLGRAWVLPERLVGSIERHHHQDQLDSQLPPAVKLVSLLRESEPARGIELLVETAREDYGLSPDWTQEAMETCAEQAHQLARELA